MQIKVKTDIGYVDERQIVAIVNAAEKFRQKVERDSPECFVPSPQLRSLFEALETRQ